MDFGTVAGFSLGTGNSGRGSIEPTTALRVCTVPHVFDICATACFMNRHSQMRIHDTVCP